MLFTYSIVDLSKLFIDSIVLDIIEYYCIKYYYILFVETFKTTHFIFCGNNIQCVIYNCCDNNIL